MGNIFSDVDSEIRRQTEDIKGFVTGRDIVQSFAGIGEAIVATEEFVDVLGEREVQRVEGILNKERNKRLRRQGLLSTIVTGKLGAPTTSLGLSTQTGTSQRTLLGG